MVSAVTACTGASQVPAGVAGFTTFGRSRNLYGREEVKGYDGTGRLERRRKGNTRERGEGERNIVWSTTKVH